MLYIDAGVFLIVMGMDKSSLTVQGFDFLGLINFVWKKHVSKKTVFHCYIYLMQLFPAGLIVQKTVVFRFGECWLPAFTKKERTRGKQKDCCAFPLKGFKSGEKTGCLQVKEAEYSQ